MVKLTAIGKGWQLVVVYYFLAVSGVAVSGLIAVTAVAVAVEGACNDLGFSLVTCLGILGFSLPLLLLYLCAKRPSTCDPITISTVL